MESLCTKQKRCDKSQIPRSTFEVLMKITIIKCAMHYSGYTIQECARDRRKIFLYSINSRIFLYGINFTLVYDLGIRNMRKIQKYSSFFGFFSESTQVFIEPYVQNKKIPNILKFLKIFQIYSSF